MKRCMALVVMICCAMLSAQQKPGVLSADEVRKVVPAVYFFRGQSASVQLRNSAGFSVPEGKLVLAGLVDTSGYASDVQAKYQGFLITEVKLNIAGTELRPGEYGYWILSGRKVSGDGRGGQRSVQRRFSVGRKAGASRAAENRRRRRRLPAVRRPEVGQPEA